MGDCHADLGQPLPEVALLGRPGLPARLKDLMGGKGTTDRHELSRRPQCLLGRQRHLRDRLLPFSAIGQRPTKRIPGPGLASTPQRVAVTLKSRHENSVSGKAPICGDG